MKCPKCQYTSFDYLDACKRCGTDLREARTLLQLIAVAPEDRAPLAPVATADEFAPSDRAFDEPSVSAFAASAAGFAVSRPLTVPESFGEEEGEEPDFGVELGASDDEELTEISFDDPFESLVEPTSYRAASVGEAEAGRAEEEEEERSLVEPTSYRDAAPAEEEEPEAAAAEAADTDEDRLLELNFEDLFADAKNDARD